jgi:hypothetical protein
MIIISQGSGICTRRTLSQLFLNVMASIRCAVTSSKEWRAKTISTILLIFIIEIQNCKTAKYNTKRCLSTESQPVQNKAQPQNESHPRQHEGPIHRRHLREAGATKSKSCAYLFADTGETIHIHYMIPIVGWRQIPT